MSLDETFVKNAMLGTDRVGTSAVLPLGIPDWMNGLLSGLKKDPSWKFLLTVGTLETLDRAAAVPVTVSTASLIDTVEPDESVQFVSPGLARLTLKILQCFYDVPAVPLLYLTRLAERGLRFPPRMLPELLDYLSNRTLYKENVAALLPVLGPAARWLGEQCPRWNWCVQTEVKKGATPEELDALWYEGTISERLSALEQRRRMSPAIGRALLEAGWKKENVKDRESFLRVLNVGLEEADIPFLEQALTDRGAGVRKVADRLLARFPQAHPGQNALIETEKIFFGSATPSQMPEQERKEFIATHFSGSALPLSPPEKFTTQMKQDGLEQKPPQGTGERSWWMAQILTRVSLDTWEKIFDRTPEELIAMYRKDDFFATLLYGWTGALLRFQAPNRWIDPLWNAWQLIPTSWDKTQSIHASLLEYVITRFPDLFWNRLKQEKSLKKWERLLYNSWFTVAREKPLPWSDRFLFAFFDFVQYFGYQPSFYNEFGALLPPEMLASIVRDMTEALVRSSAKPAFYYDKLNLCAQFNKQLESESPGTSEESEL